MPERETTRPVTIFCSYAHEDELLRERLEKHLSLLWRQGLLFTWHDRAIQPGDAWAREIDDHLNQAEIILLLVSASFLASNYCYENEMQRALERHQRGEARVVPIILHPCDWSSAPFGELQALPRNAQSITTWANQEEAFADVARRLRHLLKRRVNKTATASQAAQNRERMRQRLERWYQDFLNDSLEHATWLDLDLADKPDALYNPVPLLVRDAHLPEHLCPPGTSIIQVYEEAHAELLILGEPGSGKSTQLYTLGQHLLGLSETDPSAPFPIIFALSSWTVKQTPLQDWMGEQLTSIYHVPKKLAQQWIENQMVIPLLDGLDEMEEGLAHAVSRRSITTRASISILWWCVVGAPSMLLRHSPSVWCFNVPSLSSRSVPHKSKLPWQKVASSFPGCAQGTKRMSPYKNWPHHLFCSISLFLPIRELLLAISPQKEQYSNNTSLSSMSHA